MIHEHEMQHEGPAFCGSGYASPQEAMKAEHEKVLYTVALYGGTGIQAPDYLATVDVDPAPQTYPQVIHRTQLPGMDDELHHFGWNACSSCYNDEGKSRRFLIAGGFRSGRIYILDTADACAPRLHQRSWLAMSSSGRRSRSWLLWEIPRSTGSFSTGSGWTPIPGSLARPPSRSQVCSSSARSRGAVSSSAAVRSASACATIARG
jgi:hypothetical protein